MLICKGYVDLSSNVLFSVDIIKPPREDPSPSGGGMKARLGKYRQGPHRHLA